MILFVSLVIALFLYYVSKAFYWYKVIYPLMKAQWVILAQELNLETNVADVSKWKLFNFRSYMRGVVGQYVVEVTCSKSDFFFADERMEVKINLKTEQHFIFCLSTLNVGAYIGSLHETGDDFFDAKYRLYATDKQAVTVFEEEALRKNFISAFTTNMQGEIELKPLMFKVNDIAILLKTLQIFSDSFSNIYKKGYTC